MKDESRMFISVDAEKAFDKLQHPYDKNSQPSAHRGNVYCNIMKVIYDKPTAKTYSTVKSWELFLLRWGTRQGCPVSPLLFNIMLEVVATAIKQDKEIKTLILGRNKTVIADDMIYRKP